MIVFDQVDSSVLLHLFVPLWDRGDLANQCFAGWLAGIAINP